MDQKFYVDFYFINLGTGVELLDPLSWIFPSSQTQIKEQKPDNFKLPILTLIFDFLIEPIQSQFSTR